MKNQLLALFLVCLVTVDDFSVKDRSLKDETLHSQVPHKNIIWHLDAVSEAEPSSVLWKLLGGVLKPRKLDFPAVKILRRPR